MSEPPASATARGATRSVETVHSITEALDFARQLATGGVPVFVAYPHKACSGRGCDHCAKGYKPPPKWEQQPANARFVDAWQPGRALCMVTGVARDVADVDPRNGGHPDDIAEYVAERYGVAQTPGDGEHGPGYHVHVPLLDAKTRPNVLPGVDVKSGRSDGSSRGFTFIAPTAGYQWLEPPAPIPAGAKPHPRLIELAAGNGAGSLNGVEEPAPPFAHPSGGSTVADSGTIPDGKRDDTIRDYAARLAALPIRRAEAERLLHARWKECEQPAGKPFEWETALGKLDTAWPKFHRGEADNAASNEDYGKFYLAVSELDQLPQPEPLIDGVLDKRTLFVVAGKGGTYKSFLTFDWLASVATGRKWQGHETHQAKCLLVVGEGAYGLQRRRDAWQTAWGATIADEWLHIRRAPVNLFHGGADYADLLARVEAERYDVVLFDTLQRMTSGAEANSARDAGTVIARLGDIRAITDGTVGVVAHEGKAEGFGVRGSSAWEDDVDLVWRVRESDPEEGGGHIIATLGKRKDGPEGLEIKLRPSPVAGAGSLVLEAATGEPVGLNPPKRAFEVMQLLTSSAAPDDGMSVTRLSQALGLSGNGSTDKTLAWLIDAGYVQKTGRGRNTRYHATERGRSPGEDDTLYQPKR